MLIKDSKSKLKFRKERLQELLDKELTSSRSKDVETYGFNTVGYYPTDGRPILESADPSNYMRQDKYKKRP